MPPTALLPQSMVGVFLLVPPSVTVFLLLVVAAAALVTVRRCRAQNQIQHVEAQRLWMDMAPDKKTPIAEPCRPSSAIEEFAVMLPPPNLPSPFLWECPPAPPMSQLNSGDLARIAKSRKRSGTQSQGSLEETLRRHSYPTPNVLESYNNLLAAERARATRRRETIQFFGGVGPQDHIWRRRTLEFE